MIACPDYDLQVNRSLCFLFLESSGNSVDILPVLLSVYVYAYTLNEQCDNSVKRWPQHLAQLGSNCVLSSARTWLVAQHLKF